MAGEWQAEEEEAEEEEEEEEEEKRRRRRRRRRKRRKRNSNASVLAVLIDWQLFAGALLDSPSAEPARLVLRQPWC